MPPFLTWFAGRTDWRASSPRHPCSPRPDGSGCIPVGANGQPAFAAYQREADETYHTYAITVPTVTATGIARIVTFFDPGLFGSFGLPARGQRLNRAPGQARGDFPGIRLVSTSRSRTRRVKRRDDRSQDRKP